MLNSIGKDKRLDDLADFFSASLPGASEFAEQISGKEGDQDEDKELFDKDTRKKFAKYLDETLPKTKYFN